MQSKTPVLQYEEETGYLVLSDGTSRQIICRVGEDSFLYLWWKRGKQEIPVCLEDFIEQVNRQ